MYVYSSVSARSSAPWVNRSGFKEKVVVLKESRVGSVETLSGAAVFTSHRAP